MIGNFTGEYAFLDNDYETHITIDGIVFKTVTAAFESRKVDDLIIQFKISKKSPAEARRYVKAFVLPSDWADTQDEIMKSIVVKKFEQNPKLRQKLIATGDELLVYNNTCNDKYWGLHKGCGKNRLGTILMQVRSEFMRGK